MAWENFIDSLTETYPQEQFRVPFTTWAGIFRNIGERFIIKEWSQYMYTNWLGNVKRETPIKTILLPELDNEISKLQSNTNYWVVIVFGNARDSSQHVYDCNVDSMKVLIEWAPADFFIVDKKYNWLTYFKVDRDKSEVSISKSGDGKTPFDEAQIQ